jgi:NodT family efflux transporter outer membrane factor (OMF) lipoprotein
MAKMYRRRLAGVALAALLPCACAVGPDFQPPEAPDVATFLPAEATGTIKKDSVPGRTIVHGADVPPNWWELFRSPSLDRLVEDGLAHNQDLQAAEAAVRVAQANARAQRGALFPIVSAGFGASRTVTPYKAVSTNAANEISVYSLYTPQVTVAFVPDVWGGTRRALESTLAQTELAAFQREALYLTLASSIALAAIEEARLDGQISATRRIIDLQTQLLDILRKQNEQGQIALPDVVSQETAVAQAKLLLPPLERQLAQQRHLLAFLTGRFPSESELATFRFAAFRLPRRLPLSLPGDLVRQRPDIRAAEANLHAANAQIGVAIANRLPQIVLTGNAGVTGLNIAQLFTPGTAAAAVAGSVVQTVFDAETLESRQRAAEEATVQALAEYRSTVLTAFRNVADVLRALQADARSMEAATAAERSASQNIDLIRQQVEQGQASIPILLVAQQAFLQTSLALVDAKAARLADTVALFQALGGGWWNRPPAIPVEKGL